MVCHLVDYDNNLGRSTVVDLNAIPGKNIRQVDHRSIDFIIFRNVKYVLGKKQSSQLDLQLPIPPDRTKPKWNESQLKLGDWFSQINYYVIRSTESSSDASSPTNEDTVMVYTPKNTKDTIKMSRDILEYEMNSGKLFQKEERVTRTELVRIFTNAKQAVMTVKFYKKVDESQIKTVLNRARKMDMKDQAARKQIAT